ncbi:MAG: acetate--CoA ligase family protein [Methanomassiliicoccales archaeon]|nr:acetate--CoA ligase family protein [Methanomassiliicoccales archaeon]
MGLALMLMEYSGKELLRRYGIPTPEGYMVSDAEGVLPVRKPMVVKAQVQTGGRGKAGGIRFGSTLDQVKKATQEILDLEISGKSVEAVLIEERLNVFREIYVSMTIDRSRRLPILMIIKQGGMDVESTSEGNVMTWVVHPFVGLSDYIAREAAEYLQLDTAQIKQLYDILRRQWKLFWELDCELVEMNPLVQTAEGRLIAADAKVVIDEDAAFRHPEIDFRELGRTQLEQEAREKGLALVELDGEIGVLANGAGLTMATLDLLSMYNARGRIFLDLGGTDDEKVVEEAMSLMSKAAPKVILVNIFGGITKCDTVAEGILAARDRMDLRIPIVVRIRGVNEEEARVMLQKGGVVAFHDLEQACEKAASLTQEA